MAVVGRLPDEGEVFLRPGVSVGDGRTFVVKFGVVVLNERSNGLVVVVDCLDEVTLDLWSTQVN